MELKCEEKFNLQSFTGKNRDENVIYVHTYAYRKVNYSIKYEGMIFNSSLIELISCIQLFRKEMRNN